MVDKLLTLITQKQDCGLTHNGCKQSLVTFNEELAEHLIANGVTIQQWTPVTERLPDKELWEYQKKYNQDNMEVLVMIKGAKEPTTLYYGDDGDFNDDEGNSWLVTHWMPLPETPKEVQT